jgi:hypothetical protein
MARQSAVRIFLSSLHFHITTLRNAVTGTYLSPKEVRAREVGAGDSQRVTVPWRAAIAMRAASDRKPERLLAILSIASIRLSSIMMLIRFALPGRSARLVSREGAKSAKGDGAMRLTSLFLRLRDPRHALLSSTAGK